MRGFKALTHLGGVPAREAASCKHYTYFLFYNHWGAVGPADSGKEERMAQSKIEIKIGGLTFTGEADAAWLEKQLDKLLEFAKSANVGQNAESADAETEAKPDKRTSKHGSLSGFLKSQNATSTQVRKFLATAVWLARGRDKLLTTKQVTEAISKNQQGKLANPSQCLNNNVKRGYCVKHEKQFYVTEEGLKEIGVQAP